MKVDWNCFFTRFHNAGGCFPPTFYYAAAANTDHTQAYYNSPNYPAEDDVSSGKLWHDSQVKASCCRKIVQGPTGLIYVDYSSLEAVLGYVVSYPTGGGDCEPVEWEDPNDPSSCPPGGGGGSDPPPSDEPPSDGTWQSLCEDLALEEGYYDVYVDGQYDETIFCTNG